jgi:hypothetical protein
MTRRLGRRMGRRGSIFACLAALLFILPAGYLQMRTATSSSFGPRIGPVGLDPSAAQPGPGTHSLPGGHDLLRWSPGEAYPVVGGHTAFPPAVRSNAECDPDPCHWYQGALFSGTNTTATFVNAAIEVPAGPPKETWFYYELVSVFDNNNSYDQLGFSNDFGAGWTLTYSYTDGNCASQSYAYTYDEMSLTQGQTYNFSMQIVSTGVLYEVTDEVNGASNIVWKQSYNAFGNHASSFQIDSTACSPYTYIYDYTDYEEIYSKGTAEHPDYNFKFTYNYYRSGSSFVDTDWSEWSLGTPPLEVGTTFPNKTPSDLKIENHL